MKELKDMTTTELVKYRQWCYDITGGNANEAIEPLKGILTELDARCEKAGFRIRRGFLECNCLSVSMSCGYGGGDISWSRVSNTEADELHALLGSPLTRNRSDKPFTFIHFTIGVDRAMPVPPPAEVI